MADIQKPVVGQPGWNVAVDAVIDRVNELAGVERALESITIEDGNFVAHYTDDTSAVIGPAPDPAAGAGGPAGGVLSGSYPNPGFAVDMVEQGELVAHTSRTDNPHAVTKAQVGLGSVDNTADTAKPISTATQTALNAKANTSALAAKADTSAVVALTGNQTVAGVKTFTSAPVVPEPSAAGNPIRYDDPSRTNPRTPLPHASTHGPTGSDPMAMVATSGSYVDLTDKPNLDGFETKVRTQAELVTALAAGGDVVVDSAVTISLTTTMVIDKPTRLLGGTFTRTTGVAFQITSSNVEIAGVTIIGGGGTTYQQAQKLIHATGTSAARLANINIHDCVLRNSRADNIWLEWCDGAHIHANSIRTFLYSGIMLISGIRCRVANNDITDGILAAGQVDVYGIAATDLANTTAARSRDCVITGNTVELVDWEGIDTHGGDSITISNNIVLGCPRGIALVGGNSSRVTSPQRCIVVGNRIDGTGMRKTAREAIILGGVGSGNLADALITGNTLDNNGGGIVVDNWNRGTTYVGGNSVPLIPWTNLTMASGVSAHSEFTPQYMVDGNVVYLRGAVYRTSSGQTADVIVSSLPVAARPSNLQWFAAARAAHASGGNGVWLAYPDGTLTLGYATVFNNVNHAWPLNGSYRVP